MERKPPGIFIEFHEICINNKIPLYLCKYRGIMSNTLPLERVLVKHIFGKLPLYCF
jgi:hypothetical protein